MVGGGDLNFRVDSQVVVRLKAKTFTVERRQPDLAALRGKVFRDLMGQRHVGLTRAVLEWFSPLPGLRLLRCVATCQVCQKLRATTISRFSKKFRFFSSQSVLS